MEPQPARYYTGEVPDGVSLEQLTDILGRALHKWKNEYEPELTREGAIEVLEMWIQGQDDFSDNEELSAAAAEDNYLAAKVEHLFPAQFAPPEYLARASDDAAAVELCFEERIQNIVDASGLF